MQILSKTNASTGRPCSLHCRWWPSRPSIWASIDGYSDAGALVKSLFPVHLWLISFSLSSMCFVWVWAAVRL